MSVTTQQIEHNIVEAHDKEGRTKGINCQLGSEENICLSLLTFLKVT